MIKLTPDELYTFFPMLVFKIQQNHNMKPIAKELFVHNKPVVGLSHTRNYFLEINDDIYLQYTMQHVIVEPQLHIVARTLLEVILYADQQEFELARIADQAEVRIKQNSQLN